MNESNEFQYEEWKVLLTSNHCSWFSNERGGHCNYYMSNKHPTEKFLFEQKCIKDICPLMK